MLTLTIKRKWFNMILSGEKKEEYRDIKDYYKSRFSKVLGMNPNWLTDFALQKSSQFEVKFNNGYSKDCPAFIADCSLSVGEGKEEWGAEKGKCYYILHIKKIRWKSTDNSGGYLDEID